MAKSHIYELFMTEAKARAFARLVYRCLPSARVDVRRDFSDRSLWRVDVTAVI